MVTEDLPRVRLEAMGLEDADFVLSVRNHPTSRSYLHDARAFSREEFSMWFLQGRPEWLTIRDEEGQRVGYVRTRWRDEARTEVEVGVDIHPERRRQGYASAAYARLFERLSDKAVGTVWLEVLDHNHAAFDLYRRLGFEAVGERPYANGAGSALSIEMKKPLQKTSGRHCKVIAAWLGPRRFWAGLDGPREAWNMYRFLLDREFALDPGVPCDTIVVINIPSDDSVRESPWYRRTHELISGRDGDRTRAGRVRVMERPNVGISFGAFDHAFHECASEYDFWHLLEDDHIVLQDGCLARDVLMFKELDSDVGFVASVGCSAEVAPHCHGACGVASRSVLQRVKDANPSAILSRGHLPFWYSLADGAEGHEWNAEIRFTNEIHRLGLDLVNSRNRRFLVNWRGTEIRQCHDEVERLVEWTPDMAR